MTSRSLVVSRGTHCDLRDLERAAVVGPAERLGPSVVAVDMACFSGKPLRLLRRWRPAGHFIAALRLGAFRSLTRRRSSLVVGRRITMDRGHCRRSCGADADYPLGEQHSERTAPATERLSIRTEHMCRRWPLSKMPGVAGVPEPGVPLLSIAPLAVARHWRGAPWDGQRWLRLPRLYRPGTRRTSEGRRAAIPAASGDTCSSR